MELGLVGKNTVSPNEIRVEARDRGGMKGSFRRDVWDPNFGSDSSRFTIFWGSQMVETSKQTRVKSFRAFHDTFFESLA